MGSNTTPDQGRSSSSTCRTARSGASTGSMAGRISDAIDRREPSTPPRSDC